MGRPNWGDCFTPFLFASLGIDTVVVDAEVAQVFSCGSLIDRVPSGFTGHVLGSGMGYADARCQLNVMNPLMLRGKLTAERCTINCPVRFGDPGLLASRFVTNGRKKYKKGIVPHYVDKNHPEIEKWRKWYGVHQINIEGEIKAVVDEIAACESIVSSSLHGLVIADSLGIPNRHVRLSDGVLGDNFKFHDYYSAYGETLEIVTGLKEAFADCRARDVSAIRKDVEDVFDEYVEYLKTR